LEGKGKEGKQNWKKEEEKGQCWGESRKHVKDKTKPNPANMKKEKKEKTT